MVELTRFRVKSVIAPPLVPAERPIDPDHLSRMTLGDRALEREVLGLFLRQIELLRRRMRSADLSVARAAAHMLKGSAAAIGAFAVVRAAAEVEACAADNATDGGEMPAALRRLDRTLVETRAEISQWLRAGAN